MGRESQRMRAGEKAGENGREGWREREAGNGDLSITIRTVRHNYPSKRCHSAKYEQMGKGKDK